MPGRTLPRNRRSGNSIIEVTFMMPWLVFLFVGVYDVGFYCYTLIAAQNAARAVAVHNSVSKTAASDPDGSGCQVAINELHMAAYGQTMTGCTAAPLIVTPTLVTGGNSPDGHDAAQVVLTYTTPAHWLIPLPLVIPNSQVTITKSIKMRIDPSGDF